MIFKRCQAIKPNGKRCRNVAKECKKYCHSHVLWNKDKVAAVPKMWECEVCHERFPFDEIFADDIGALLCDTCYDKHASVLVLPPKGPNVEFRISVSQQLGMAQLQGFSPEQTMQEIIEGEGCHIEMLGGTPYFVKSRA